MKSINTILTNVDNFEYYEDHADIYDTAATAVPQLGIARSIANTAGNIKDAILGKKTDVSFTGWKNYIATHPPLPYYPSADELVSALKSIGAEQYVINAITSGDNTYDQNTGHWGAHDFNFVVTGLNPITVTDFKGASEQHVMRTNVNAKPQSIAQNIASTNPTQANKSGLSGAADLSALAGGFSTTTWLMTALVAIVALGLLFYFANK